MLIVSLLSFLFFSKIHCYLNCSDMCSGMDYANCISDSFCQMDRNNIHCEMKPCYDIPIEFCDICIECSQTMDYNHVYHRCCNNNIQGNCEYATSVICHNNPGNTSCGVFNETFYYN